MKPLKLEELTLEQKIGQLIIVRGFIDEADRKYIMEMTENKAVGGFQIGYSPTCKELIAEINERAGYPILICANMEYGFAGTKTKFPALLGLSATNDPELAYKAARVAAIETKAFGFNMIWGPVVDYSGAGKICKNTRTMGDDPETVTRFAKAIVKGYADEGVLATAKHFPGGSDGTGDNHLGLTSSEFSLDELCAHDLVPYLELFKNSELPALMTTHKIFKNIDPDFPATLSKKMMGIAREKGFDGLIQSDSLAMMGVCQAFGEKECLALAIAAGCDQVLPNYRLPFKDAYDALMEAYNKGIITPQRLDEAVRRIIEAQNKTLKEASKTELTDEDYDTIEELNKKGLCYLGKDGVAPELSKDGKKVFVLCSENEYPYDSAENPELEEKDTFAYKNVLKQAEMVKEYFPEAETIIISEYPNHVQNEKVALAASRADEVVFCTFCRPHSYLGSDGITNRVEYLIKSNPKKTAAVLHIGNPYEVSKLTTVPRVFLGHLGGDSLKYTLRALKGEFVPTGKIPVKI